MNNDSSIPIENTVWSSIQASLKPVEVDEVKRLIGHHLIDEAEVSEPEL